jgi:tetratricopeptide (TPR) repeat protein
MAPITLYQPGSKIENRYEVVSRPLMGGMGVVYLCVDSKEDRPVALKTFRPELLPDRAARDRFLREATTWMELGSHPHIVRCYNVTYLEDGEIYLVLQLIAKEQNHPDASLRPWLVGAQRLTADKALMFALQIAWAMRHATTIMPGFVHRDLKPENVLVSAERLPGTQVNRLGVTDFGLASAVHVGAAAPTDATAVSPADLDRTQLTKGAMGTPMYMAPEQWRGETVTAATDVYAFGCILYEMLTGQRAVSGTSMAALEQAHCQGQVQPMLDDVHPAIRAIVTICLRLAPAERYPNWSTLAEALRDAYCAAVGTAPPQEEPAGTSGAHEQLSYARSVLEIGNAYRDLGKFEVALSYFARARDIARALGEVRLALQVQLAQAIAHRNLGRADEALALAEEVAGSGHTDLISGALIAVGQAHNLTGDYQRALATFQHALEVARSQGDLHNEAICGYHIGNHHSYGGDPARGAPYLERSLAIERLLRNRVNEGRVLGSLGQLYRRQGDRQRGLSYSQAALTIFQELGDALSQGRELSFQGHTYFAMKDIQNAMRCWLESLRIAEDIQDVAVLGNDAFMIAQVLASARQYAGALAMAEKAHQAYVAISHARFARDARTLVDKVRASMQQG